MKQPEKDIEKAAERIEVEDLYKRRTKDEVKAILEKEGNQMSFQFKEWWDVFQVLVECRRFCLPDLYAHSILSNRFELTRKNHVLQGRLDEKAVLPDLSDLYNNAKELQLKFRFENDFEEELMYRGKIDLLESLAHKHIISLNNIKE